MSKVAQITNITTHDASQAIRESGEGTKVEKDESLIDGGKSPMMTMYNNGLWQTVPLQT